MSVRKAVLMAACAVMTLGVVGAASQSAQAQLFNESKSGKSGGGLTNGSSGNSSGEGLFNGQGNNSGNLYTGQNPSQGSPSRPSPSYDRAQKTTTPGGNNGFARTNASGISEMDRRIREAAEYRRAQAAAAVEASKQDFAMKIAAREAQQQQPVDPASMREDRRFGSAVQDLPEEKPIMVYDKNREDTTPDQPTRLFNSVQ